MANLGCINKKLGLADITDGIAGTPDSQRRNLVEGSLTVNGSAIDIELKNRTLEKAERGIDAAISTAGEWGWQAPRTQLLVRSRQEPLRSEGYF